jgi:hypothetical protein
MAESDPVAEHQGLQARIAELERRNFQLQTIYDIGWELECRSDLLLDPTATGSLRVILATIVGAFGATCGLALQTGRDSDEREASVAVQKGFDEDQRRAYSQAWDGEALRADYCRWLAGAPATSRTWRPP